MQSVKCDILICGSGLAGLSLLYRAIKAGLWIDKTIIVVDQSGKSENDRTWSFWKDSPSDFDDVIYKEWKNLSFFDNNGDQICLKSGNYTYNSIRSIDFYNHIFAFIKDFTNITFVQSVVEEIISTADKCILKTNTHTYTATYLFNSLYKKPELKVGEQYFLQHFKGVKISTKSVIPKLTDAYLMDFRTSQQEGTTFFYTLPTANNELFVEYTLFSKSVLPAKVYEKEIAKYLTNILKITDYEILEDEYGVIPMTDHQFKRFDGNIVHIGTIGGDTRASTGYTFTNTQKTIGKIISSFKNSGHPFFINETIGLKQHLYDATLLNVLAERKYEGHQLFTDLFKNTKASVIFSFLDAETSILQDVQIMKSLKIFPFLKAFFAAVYRNMLSNRS